MKICFAIWPFLFVFISLFTYGQQINKDTTFNRSKDSTSTKSYLEVGLDYQNDNVYLGRKDSMRLPYITPYISYYHKSGFFITGSLSYLSTSVNSHTDLFSIEGGYQFSRKKFEAEISCVKYFYNSQSTNVKSDMKGDLHAYSSFNIGFVKPSLETTVSFSSATDVNLMLGLEHTLNLPDRKTELTPSFFLNIGTQNYYSSYYSKRRYGGMRKKKRMANGTYYDITAQVDNASKLKVLDYEITLPINYLFKNFVFSFTPAFAIPVNPSVLTVTVKTSTGSQITTTSPEKIGNIFYYTFGASYTFHK